MLKSNADRKMDKIIKTALQEYVAIEIAKAPSDEHLARMHPISYESYEKIINMKQKKKRTSEIMFAVFEKAALIFVVCAIVLCELLLARGGAVASGSDSSIEWYNGYAEICFGDRTEINNTGSAVFSNITVRYIPVDFEITYFSDNTDSKKLIYSNNNGAEISIMIESSVGVACKVNTNSAEYKKMKIDGYDVHYFYYCSENRTCVFYGDDKTTVRLDFLRIDQAEILKIIESIE